MFIRDRPDILSYLFAKRALKPDIQLTDKTDNQAHPLPHTIFVHLLHRVAGGSMLVFPGYAIPRKTLAHLGHLRAERGGASETMIAFPCA